MFRQGGGGGGSPLDPPPPLKQVPAPPPPPPQVIGQTFLRVFGQSKNFSGTFGASQFRQKKFFGASNNSTPPPPTTKENTGRKHHIQIYPWNSGCAIGTSWKRPPLKASSPARLLHMRPRCIGLIPCLPQHHEMCPKWSYTLASPSPLTNPAKSSATDARAAISASPTHLPSVTVAPIVTASVTVTVMVT